MFGSGSCRRVCLFSCLPSNTPLPLNNKTINTGSHKYHKESEKQVPRCFTCTILRPPSQNPWTSRHVMGHHHPPSLPPFVRVLPIRTSRHNCFHLMRCRTLERNEAYHFHTIFPLSTLYSVSSVLTDYTVVDYEETHHITQTLTENKSNKQIWVHHRNAIY